MLGAVLFASSVMGSKLQQQSQRNHTRASDHEAPTPALTHSLAVALALESHAYERELQEAIELARAAGRHLQRSLLEAKSITSKDQDTAGMSPLLLCVCVCVCVCVYVWCMCV
jgi:hypothetical protein